MAVAGLAEASNRLLDMLDSLGSSPGAERKSLSGPSGEPSREVVRAFEDALAGPGETGAVAAPAPTDPASVSRDMPPAAIMPGEERVQVQSRVPEADSAREVSRLIGKVGEGSMTPEELFRLQYLVGMLRAHGAAGQQGSAKASEAVESLLKQKG